jgi:hypothetical protein
MRTEIPTVGETHMTRLLIVAAAVFALAVPTALAAPPAGKGKPESPGKSAGKGKPESPGKSAAAPGQSVEQNAAKACKAERGTSDASIAAFKSKYGTNANTANALGKCVSGKVKRAEAQAEAAEKAEENAAKKCKAERGTTDASIAAFKTKYGTNANKANAFGKCVSTLAKAQGSS